MLTYRIDERGTKPRYQFLYEKIKEDILKGTLPPGSRLPSKRALAEHNGVSVITVEYAYRLLTDEGYAEARERSGYFVCDLARPAVGRPAVVPIFDEEVAPPAEIDFPFSTLCKITRQVMNKYGEALLVKPEHNGCAILRNAISEYLLRYRGMLAPPERIVIGSGAEYLYMMIVQLLGRDRLYGIEDPSYEKIRQVYLASGARCEMLEMDRNGIASAALSRTAADVLHVTPYHSFPSGITAPAAKRLEYLKWAQERNGIVIEDDFDSEFAPLGRPVETVFSMDHSDCVIYLNTFSKTLAPSMRMGYMILPQRLTEVYRGQLGFYSCTVPVFDQYVLAEFISGGYFERRLGRMRRKKQK